MRTKMLCATAAVLAVHLALASIVVAQTVDDELPPAPVRPRIELGAAAGNTLAFPEFGVVASIPTGQYAAVELIVGRMPALADAPPHSLAQLQARIPFREHLLGRKSLTVGLTRIAIGDRPQFFGDDSDLLVRPHAGVSLQWPTGPAFDVRLDLQGIFTFDGELPMVPRAMTAFVWHPRTRR
jgi:hypothetical protein